MAEYINREAAICIADYAVDEHPYDKNPEKPETFSDYNQGWNDACDYIRERLENAEKADVAEVRHARWIPEENGDVYFACSYCGCEISTSWDYDDLEWNFCPECGYRMDGGADNGERNL